ncbi:hypothetical protein V8E55_002490 [Tylopilus felleus]
MARRAQPGPSMQKPPANVTTPPVPSMVPRPKASTMDPLPSKISWEGGHTDTLVTWIISRPADRHVLYHNRYSSSSTLPPSGDKPSGKNKKEVAAIIAQHIFRKDPEHSVQFAADPAKYTTSVINQLSALKSKYRDQHARFKSTGSGVAPPDNGNNPPNLHEDVIATFPYYKELHTVWGGVPSFDSQLVSSKPKVNHTENLLKIMQSRPNANQSIDEDNEMQDGVEGGDDEGNKEPSSNVEVGASLQPKDPAGYNDEIEMYHLAANPLHTISSSSLKSSMGSSPSPSLSTKMASSLNRKDVLMAKINELDQQSKDIKHHGLTRVLKYNYTIQKQELNVQKQELDLQQEEHVAKQADAELKQEEECAYQRQIELLRLQIQYQHAVQIPTVPPTSAVVTTTFPPSPSTATPPGPSNAACFPSGGV